MLTSICNGRGQKILLELQAGLKVKVVIKDKTGGSFFFFFKFIWLCQILVDAVSSEL